MKTIYHFLLISLLSASAAAYAHGQTPSRTSGSTGSERSEAKRGPVFRANKEQVKAAQSMLKTRGLYTGEATGKLDPATRDAIKGFQKGNGLRATGTLNRATLEKMGIELTEKQKQIPVSSSSFASESAAKGGRRAVFRATKEQVMRAQQVLKAGGLYSGTETGTLDDTTRDGLRKYQESKGLKVTGTLNQLTLEKMGIALTDKQKAAGESM